ncbi:MAG TPA: hypothetical protein VGI74_12490 [Streptosporangiaceae bacterium]
MTSAAGAAAVLLAAGCGGSSATPSPTHPGASSLSPIQAITLAAHQAKAVNSAAFTLDVHTTGTTSENLAGSIQIRLQPSLLASEDFSTLTVNGRSVPGGIQEIMNSQTIYMKMALLQQALGKPWVRVPYAELRQATGLNLGQLVQQVQDYNPMVQTQMLAGAKDVKTAGTQTIGGVKTTEYTGTYTMSAAMAKIPSSFRSLMQKQVQSMGLGLVQFKVWLDAQHQARKLITVEPGKSTQITVTVQVTGINQPVSVTYPPASQVATIPIGALKG